MMVSHPFIGNLSELTMEELQEKISELRNKMTFAGRMARHDMVNQIQMAMSSYQQEYQKRQQELWEKSFKKTK